MANLRLVERIEANHDGMGVINRIFLVGTLGTVEVETTLTSIQAIGSTVPVVAG